MVQGGKRNRKEAVRLGSMGWAETGRWGTDEAGEVALAI